MHRSAACLEQGDAWCQVCHAQANLRFGEDGAIGGSSNSSDEVASRHLGVGEFGGSSSQNALMYVSGLSAVHARAVSTTRASSATTPVSSAATAGRRALLATFMSASCERHDKYLQRLMSHIQVDSYGGCYKNAREEKDFSFELLASSSDARERQTLTPKSRNEAKLLIASTYKFYLSIENTILDDYITEKFYQGFRTPSVMVYLGAPNARDFAPANHSFIDALDFESPQHLAQFLQRVAADDMLYEAYNMWRQTRSVSAHFMRAVEHDLTLMDSGSVLCRTCLHASRLKCGQPPLPQPSFSPVAATAV